MAVYNNNASVFRQTGPGPMGSRRTRGNTNTNTNNNNKRLSVKMGAYTVTKPSEKHSLSNGWAASNGTAQFKARLEQYVGDATTPNGHFVVANAPRPSPGTPANPISGPEIIVNPFGNPHPLSVSANAFLNNARARGAIIVKSAAEAQRLRAGQPRKSCLKRPGSQSFLPRRVRFDAEDRAPGDHKRWMSDMRKQQKERKKTGQVDQSDSAKWEPSFLCEDFPMTGVSEAQDAAAARLIAFENELDEQHKLAKYLTQVNKAQTSVISSKRQRHLHPCLRR